MIEDSILEMQPTDSSNRPQVHFKLFMLHRFPYTVAPIPMPV